MIISINCQKSILKTVLIAFCASFLLLGHQSFSQKRPGRKSAVTGQRFKIKNKKGSRKPINYINSIKLIGGLNTATYFGELCDGGDCLGATRPSASIGALYRFNENFSFRSEFSWIRFTGSDEGTPNATNRGLSFRADNVEWATSVIYDILPYNKMYRRRRLVSPYVTVGLGVLYNNPKAAFEGTFHSLRPLRTEGVSYNALSIVIPYGVGVRFKLNPQIDLFAEANYRLTFTDYLDDISTEYDPTKSGLSPNDIERILSDRRAENGADAREQSLSQRGNPDDNDGYFLFSVKIAYTLRVTKQRYSLRNNVSKFRITKKIKRK